MSSQEATIICADNSEWMRNGDYVPNRLEAEKDAIRMVANVKTQQNVESTVGLITMAGRSPEVLVTLTPDIGKILSAVHSIQLGDRCDVLAALRIAQNKDQRQRIVLFIGSPIECDKKKLTQLGAWLKKNNVAVDIVSFGELLENTSLLDEFWKAVNNNDNSRLVVIPHGPHVLSDALSASPILDGAEALGLGLGGVGDGFDTDADESVRMAIEMSILDEQQRLARAAQASGTDGASAAASTATPTTPTPTPTPTTPTANTNPRATESTSLVTPAGGSSEMDVDDDEALLAAAMELSRQTPTAGTLDVADTAAMLEEDGDEDELAGSYDNLSEEEQMRLALQLSMQTAKEEATTTAAPAPTSAPAPEPATPAAPAATAATTAVDTTPAATASVATPAAPARKDDKPDYSAELNNPEYLNSLFQDLPGVDFSSSSIQNILSAIGTGGTPTADKPKDEPSGDTKKDDDKDASK